MTERKMRNAGYSQTSFLRDITDHVGRFVDDVIVRGRVIPSRYGPSYEILGGRFETTSGLLVTRKGINYSLGWMELLQLVAGVYDIKQLKRVAPGANHSLFTEQMAYGPRINNRMRSILQALQKDPDTRQAVLFVAKPEDGPTSNLPCTLTIQFLMRYAKLNAIVSMRSWDLCRGLPYDLMMFSGLLEIVARCLGAPTGKLIVQAGSAHVYLDQLDKVPYPSGKGWRFTENSPIIWNDFVNWARKEIFILEKGGTPEYIEYYVVDSE